MVTKRLRFSVKYLKIAYMRAILTRGGASYNIEK